jgi:hypothetical protein
MTLAKMLIRIVLFLLIFLAGYVVGSGKTSAPRSVAIHAGTTVLRDGRARRDRGGAPHGRVAPRAEPGTTLSSRPLLSKGGQINRSAIEAQAQAKTPVISRAQIEREYAAHVHTP